ncbi:hypothetical protein LX83_003669 [Goodfellowiella coeruleoviolacea]|uniref:Uncharacterized protein n=1 Tax=Goodfellowiella coeruleoviolacea TaxID=334858 RepID=A0AAE3GG63_9PSEU|nr:hypothetical protein [Goodfellowiella coeruleoviolacea]
MRYICYEWQGRPKDAHDAARRDRAAPVPPLLIQEWQHKPGQLRAGAHEDVGSALAWLRVRVAHHLPTLLPGHREAHPGWDAQARYAHHVLTCSGAYLWGRYSRDLSLIELAVITDPYRGPVYRLL